MRNETNQGLFSEAGSGFVKASAAKLYPNFPRVHPSGMMFFLRLVKGPVKLWTGQPVGGCSGVFRGVLRVFREWSVPVPAFTDTPRFTLSRAQSLVSSS